MQRIQLARLLLQDLATDPFCFAEFASFVVLEGDRELAGVRQWGQVGAVGE